MIELWIEGDPREPQFRAKGLTPGQCLRIYTGGHTWIVTRFGAECTTRREEEK